MSDEALRQAAEILSAATEQYRVHHAKADAFVANADDTCDHEPEDCDCATPDEMRADAAVHAQLANAAATMALAMVGFITAKE